MQYMKTFRRHLFRFFIKVNLHSRDLLKILEYISHQWNLEVRLDLENHFHHKTWISAEYFHQWRGWWGSTERGRPGAPWRWGGVPWFLGSWPPPLQWSAAGHGFQVSTGVSCSVPPGPRYTYRHCRQKAPKSETLSIYLRYWIV